MLVYKMVPTGAGSAKYGNCELCHKPSASIIDLILHDVSESSVVPVSNVFGCQTCLEARIIERGAILADNIPTGMQTP